MAAPWTGCTSATRGPVSCKNEKKTNEWKGIVEEIRSKICFHQTLTFPQDEWIEVKVKILGSETLLFFKRNELYDLQNSQMLVRDSCSWNHFCSKVTRGP